MDSHRRSLPAQFRLLATGCVIAAFFCPPRTAHAQYVARQPRPKADSPQSGSDTQTNGAGQVPSRFLGWNYGQRAGAAYFQRFARRRHGLAIPVQNASSGGTIGSTRRTASFATSLTSPATLPGFAFRPTLPAGFIPDSVATGDFNSDGRLDWVVANGGDDNVWLYLGNGDGTSQLPTIIPLAGSPVQVVAADLRGIGTLDLIVAEPDSSTIGVLMGDGHGGFSTEARFPLPAPPLSLAVQDFNGDGHLDIVAGLEGTQQTGALAYLQGNGDGSFGSPITTEGPPLGVYSTIVEFSAADLNGDKLPDVVAFDVGSLPGTWIYLNEGDGTFGLPQPGPTPNAPGLVATNFALADLNRDGCVDLVLLDTWDLAERYFGNCDGTFQMSASAFKAFGVGEIGYGIGLADVNGDGNLDIVSSGIFLSDELEYGWQSGHLVSVLMGDGEGGFSPPTVYRGEPGMYSLAVADLKGDGFPDIITANQDTDSVSVYANNGQGGFGPPQGAYIGYYVNGVSTGVVNAPLTLPIAKDVNGDGKPDLSLLEGTSPGDSCGTCDNLGVLLNQGNGILAPVLHSDVLGTRSDSIGDTALAGFRSPLLPDLIVAGTYFSTGAPYLSFAPNEGGGKFGPASVTSPPGVNGQVAVGDFNRDGKPDFLSIGAIPGSEPNTVTQLLTLFLGDGAGGFTPGYSTGFNVNSDLGVQGVWAGDFNGDGKLDVLVQEGSELVGTLGHDVYEFLGNGDGTFAVPKIVLTNAGPITVADLNHDGRPDITELVVPLSTPAFGTRLQFTIYLCQPDGSFTLGNTYEPYSGKIEIGNEDLINGPFLADLNGDGNLDIAVFQSPTNIGSSNYEDNTYFQILAGNGDGTFTPTYTVFDITTPRSPQIAADVTGDGRADLIELDQATSSYHVIPAVPGPAMQIRMVSNPVIGSNGNVQIILAVPSSSSTTINLSTSDPAITIPTSSTIPAGSVSQNIPFQLGPTFNPSHVFSIQAQLGTEIETVYGTQAAHVEGFTMYLAFTSYTVAGGQTTPDYLLNIGSVGGYSTTVQVQCMGLPAGASCLVGDPQLTLTGYGAITSLVVETASSVPAGSYPFTVMATDGTISRTTMGTLVVVQGPALQISPAILSFPIQTVGTTSSPQSATITNSGSATMRLSVSLDATVTPDPNFAQANNCGSSLDAGKSCTVSVNFTPTITGSVTGAINVDANTLGATRSYINLIGTAEGKLIKLSSSSLNFNTPLYVGQTSAAQSVTVWNTGTVPINFSGITITGTNAADFALAARNDCAVGAQLGVGLGCAINVIFAPSASGARTATLAIADDVSGSPQTVSLSGSASPPDFTMGAAPGTASSVTVTAGSSAAFTIAVAPLGAFNQTVTLNCPGAPLEATCSVSPTSVTLSGSGSQNVMVTVTTKARSTAMPREPFPPTVPPRVWWILLVTIVSLSLLGWWAERRATWGRSWHHVSFGKLVRVGPRRYFVLGSILLAVTLWASCGGGGSAASPSSPGTPPGNYGMVVNGTSGNISHSTTLTLIVK